jgi:hypothetical protein
MRFVEVAPHTRFMGTRVSGLRADRLLPEVFVWGEMHEFVFWTTLY